MNELESSNIPQLLKEVEDLTNRSNNSRYEVSKLLDVVHDKYDPEFLGTNVVLSTNIETIMLFGALVSTHLDELVESSPKNRNPRELLLEIHFLLSAINTIDDVVKETLNKIIEEGNN